MTYAEKIIIMKEDVGLDIAGITLLSDEEYHRYRDIIPKRDYPWWLRSAFYGIKCFAGFVNEDGELDYMTVKHKFGLVPLIVINRDTSDRIGAGDRFRMKDMSWTAISDRHILCDDSLGNYQYREDWQADDANDFDASDIREMLIDWWESD